MSSADTIYVTFRKKDDRFTGHAIGLEPPTDETFQDWARVTASPSEGGHNRAEATQVDLVRTEPANLSNVISSFSLMMATYRNMIPLTIELSPMVSSVLANQEIGAYVTQWGEKVSKFESDEFSVYELPRNHLSTLAQKHEASVAATKGAEHLPEISVIGLISVYDAFLARLLKVVFKMHEEMVLTSDREIKYSDLIRYGSLEEAKNQIIEKDVESVIRNSHHEQFSWMEKKFKLKLREGVKSWPEFIEICERRNILTHTGGIVSEQYRANCMSHGCKDVAKVGEKLATDAVYFKNAVQIVSEIGFKLGHVMWRKFAEAERADADSSLNQTALDLIVAREYQLAEKLLEFGAYTFKKHASDSTRRMMIVNLANAMRLQKQGEKAKQILDQEDWSATGPNFQICVAAVREDIDTVCSLMRQGSGALQPEDYRDWPVFRGIRQSPAFRAAYRDIFGHEVLSAGRLKIESPDNASGDEGQPTERRRARRRRFKVIENEPG